MRRALPRLTPAMTVLAVIVVLLVLVDAAVATRLVATRSNSPAAGSSRQTATGHPCNHGYYVSQAAHAKKGGHSVRGSPRATWARTANARHRCRPRRRPAPDEGSDG